MPRTTKKALSRREVARTQPPLRSAEGAALKAAQATATKPTWEEYFDWAATTTGIDLKDRKVESLFEFNASTAMNAIGQSEYWKSLPGVLKQAAENYQREKRADLFQQAWTFEVHLGRKSYSSLLEKLFRRNVLENRNFPLPPHENGWISPESAFEAVDDLVRTTVTCNYLDGPHFVHDCLTTHARESNLETRTKVHSSDFGHYAYHLYVAFTINLATPTSGLQERKVWLEIQTTTLPQELLSDLTHKYYRQHRIASAGNQEWRWEYGTKRFKARYICHALHLLEAMILEVRDRKDDNE